MRSMYFLVGTFLAGMCLTNAHGQYVDEFPIPTALAGPGGITSGSDGSLWFTESSTNSIGNFDPISSRIIQELTLPHEDSFPTSIVTGPDGNVWFTESENRRLGMIVPPNTIVEFDLPSGTVSGDALVADPSGYIWFSTYTGAGAGLARISTDLTHSIQTFSLPVSAFVSEVAGLTLGVDGNLWLTESSFDRIGRAINPRIARVLTADPTNYSEFAIDGPFAEEPLGITNGSDGNLWFTSQRGIVGHISPVAPYEIVQFSTGVKGTSGIVKGPDDNIWCADSWYGTISSITPAEVISTFDIPVVFVDLDHPTHPEPTGIVAGSDNNIWFTDPGTNQIGVVRFDGIFKDKFDKSFEQM
jgi:streptogramin lyase